jgi:glutamate/tyrosine decarboxylase-like PLP-dependent enzyme
MSGIPDKGLSENGIWTRLEGFYRNDMDWRLGQMFGHAFIAGDEVRRIAEKSYVQNLWGNAIDPTLFPSIMELEKEIISIAAQHLNGDEEVVGNFTSGGTESIMLAVKTARDRTHDRKPGISAPEMVIPITAHAAFFKSAHYLGIKPVVVGVNEHTFQADVQAISEAITDNTIMIVASAPSYAHGVMDPISDIGNIAQRRGIFFHVDACMGGFILPYFRQLGREVPPFDFSVSGVCSISMDFHKYAFAPKGSSVIMYRNKELRRYQIFACSEWAGYPLVNPTVQSSRSGGALAATWAVLNFMGYQGYLETARRLKNAADKVTNGVKQIPDLNILGSPVMCLIAVSSDKVNIFQLIDTLRARGWYHQAQLKRGNIPASLHLTIVPPNTEHIDKWLQDLKECVDATRGIGESPLAKELVKHLKGGLTTVGADELGMLMQAGGITDGRLPGKMADINEVLNQDFPYQLVVT